MHIHFRSISWKNFLSTGNAETVIELDSHDTSLIVGTNGAGKSTILDAITFALYNKPFRSINKPQLINSINKKDCLVTVEFRVGKNEYKVVRGIKPNVFEIYKNGEMLDQEAAAKDQQETLEKYILNLNFKAFCQIVIVGSASYVPFMQLTTANRREVIEDILDIGVFSTMSTLLKADASEARDELKDLNTKIRATEDKLCVLERAEAKARESTDGIIEELQTSIDETKKLIPDLKSDIEEIDEKIQTWKPKLEGEDETKAKQRKLLSAISKLEAQVDANNKEMSFYKKNDNCPTCGQTVDEVKKDECITRCESENEEHEEKIRKARAMVSKTESKLESYQKIHRFIREAESRRSRCESDIRSYEQAIVRDTERIGKLNVKKDDVDYTSEIEEINQELAEEEEEINKTKARIKILTECAKVLKDDGIKASVVKQYIPVMNKMINGYLQSMDFFVKFELDETFNETILHRHRDNHSYMSFSEGEKFRIDLSLILTWRKIAKMKNSVSSNLLLLDEVFDSSLDVGGTEEFSKLIAELGQDTNVFVISHKGDQLFDKFDRTLRLEKHKNFSRVVE